MTLVLDVTNVGDGPGSYQPTVTFEGESISTDEITLDAGESGTLTVDIATVTPGTRPVFVDGQIAGIAFVESSDEGN